MPTRGKAISKGTVGEDHRVRVAREKRTRMRTILLDSVVEVCSPRAGRNPAVIDDVIRHAGVSRGTFYKYFDSLDQAVREIAIQLADEMADTLTEMLKDEGEAALQFAISFQVFLHRASRDHAWGGFVCHLGLLSEKTSDGLARGLRSDLERGMATGAFQLKSIDFAADMVLGTIVEAVLRIISQSTPVDYIQIMTEMVLRGLGMEAGQAIALVQRAHARLVAEGPAKTLWRDGE